LARENLDDALALQALLRHARHVAHRVLNAPAVTAERASHRADEQADDGADDGDQQRELVTLLIIHTRMPRMSKVSRSMTTTAVDMASATCSTLNVSFEISVPVELLSK